MLWSSSFMNYNITAYSIYLPLAFAITIKVGVSCYYNGAHYLVELMQGNTHLAHTINRYLLMGYLLLNLGYTAVTLSFWPGIHSSLGVVTSCSFSLGCLMLLLGFMHYFNMLVTYLIRKKINNHVSPLKLQVL